MARYKGRPGRYQPGLEYYLRRKPEGGDLRDPGEMRPSASDLDARRECLVLVHGYNNHEGEAAEAYLGFRDRQYAHFGDLQPRSLEKLFGDAFWPGDADWAGPIDWADFLFYPVAVGVAKTAAPRLAVLIGKLPALEQVDFIGHSLGCRLVLETAAKLHASGRPRIGRICLMAAAVPCEMVEPGGRFEPLLLALQAGGTKVHVLHSKKDSVLKYAFPLGQPLAGEPTRGALGRFGPPVDMPGRGHTVSDRRIAGADHGHYWGHAGNDASEEATREAGEFFKIGTRARGIASRADAETREIGSDREIDGEPGW